MADFLVLQDYQGYANGQSLKHDAGTIISDRTDDLDILMAGGCPFIAYDPVTMDAAVEAFRSRRGSLGDDADLVPLLVSFGVELPKTRYRVRDNAFSISTINVFAAKLTLELPPSFPGGPYESAFSYGWAYDATNNDFEGRLFSSTQLGELHKQEPKDSGGGGSPGGTNQRMYVSRKLDLVLPPGEQTLELQWRPQTNGVQASIFEAELSLVRSLP